MGNLMSLVMRKEPPPPLVLVPPLFDFPPIAARDRMMESSYNLLFGKLALKCLFEDYFVEAGHFSTMIMLKPLDDPHVDLIATVSSPLDNRQDNNIVGNALFRWQSDIDNPHTFTDLFVSNSEPILRMRACAYFPQCGFGAFGIFPVLSNKRVSKEDYGVMGLRYGSPNLSFGATLIPLSVADDLPKHAWLVSKIGRLTAGVQYEPEFGNKDWDRLKYVRNWSCAVGYGLGSGSPLSPSFNFSLELAKGSQFIASFYQHVVVQRRNIDSSVQVKNPFEESEVVGITNYLDFGFELQSSIDDLKTSNDIPNKTFQIAASWQANKNLLVKAKAGPRSSTATVAFKSWWKPSFTFSLSATRDHTVGNTALGFGLRVDNVREASYQRADPNYVMLTPSKEHLAEGIQWKVGKRPMLQSDLNSSNFSHLPRELRPFHNIL